MRIKANEDTKTELLSEISEAVAQICDRQELFNFIYEKIPNVLPFDDCRLSYLCDANGKPTRKIEYYKELSNDSVKKINLIGFETFRGQPIKIANSPAEKWFLSTEPTIGEVDFELSKYLNFYEAPTIQKHDLKEYLNIPVKNRGEIFGNIMFFSKDNNFYSETDFPLFKKIANQLGLGMMNILNYQKIRESEAEKSVQLEIINLLTAKQSYENLITKIAAAINKIIPLDAFAINVQKDGRFIDFEYNDLRAVKENGEFRPLRRYSYWKENGLSDEKLNKLIAHNAELLARKAVYNAEDYLRLIAENELIRMISQNFGFHSTMYAPINLQNGGIMTLVVSSRQENSYSDELLEKFCQTGKQISLAVEAIIAFTEISDLKSRLEEENLYLSQEVKTAYNFSEIIGNAPALQEVFRQVELVSPTATTVLLEGETGTGKELFARAIHDLSLRKSRPLIKINCAALPANLIESELFGHERGAFTGAGERRIGKFELAHQGTIFLDEISELPLELQAKLLRVLQEREIERIGGKQPLKIDIRIVVATNRDLRSEVAKNNFRQDLYFRLNTVVLKLPSLRQRREDIPALAMHFANKYANRIGRKIDGISNKMLAELMQYDFPGNVRELEHIIEESVIFSKGGFLQLHRPLSFENFAANSVENILIPPKTLAQFERDYLLEILARTGGRIRGEEGAAKILDVKPTTLEAKMKKLGIKKHHS